MSTVLGIDQSLNATGLVVIEDGKMVQQIPINFESGGDNFFKINVVVDNVDAVIGRHSPDIVAIEDYARMAQSSSIIPLVELGGAIKHHLWKLGYREPIDGKVPEQKVLLVQNQSSMKKFVFGDGHTTKDTSYLLKVMQRVNLQFTNDNLADAYMHAWMAAIVISVIRNKAKIGDLPEHQQESLIAGGVKRVKGLSLKKAMKLSDEEKLKLVRI